MKDNKIVDLQITQALITPNCRKIHGDKKAIDIALEHIRKRILETMIHDCNDKADFGIIAKLRRQIQ